MPSQAAATTCPISPAVTQQPTFSAHILPALQSSCGSAASTCHGGVAPVGHVRYDTISPRTATDVYNDLVGVTPTNAPPGYERIKPFDPDHSWLIEKITQDAPGFSSSGSTYGARMPYGLPDVCQATVDTFRAWINQGALDN